MTTKSKSFNSLIPPALKETLRANPKAKAVFNKLSGSHRSEYVIWITQAKKKETVQRRLKQLIPMLLAKQSGKA